jgi:NAD-dependent dihydropyrimidine dehydrogenase PreA subunit
VPTVSGGHQESAPGWSCGESASAPYAVSAAKTEEEYGVTYVIAEPCVDLLDKACIEECPVDCIYEGNRMLYIHPDECVDCGACEPVCPVEAIYYEDDLPEQWSDYYKANVEFFDEVGSPGGAAKVGKIDADHPIIAALPKQEHD